MDSLQLLREAFAFHQQGRLAEAERLYRRVLEAVPRQFEALHYLGLAQYQQGNLSEALRNIGAALELAPNSADALFNYGAVLFVLKRWGEALECFDKVLALTPQEATAHYNRGNALEALERREEALASYDKALALQPGHFTANYNRGNVLAKLGRYEEAIVSFDRALTLRGDAVDVFVNRGNAFAMLFRYQEALANFERALALKPDRTDALTNRGKALIDLARFEEASASFERALAIKPNDVDALLARGDLMSRIGQTSNAIADFRRVLAIRPGHRDARTALKVVAMSACDWKEFAQLEQQIAEGTRIISPVNVIAFSDDPLINLKRTKEFVQEVSPKPARPLWNGTVYRHEKIRLAYVSGDFRVHAVSILTAELFELHDRSRFEVVGLSFGPDDKSAMRARLIKAFDRFHDVRFAGDHDAAKWLRDNEIDIAIDLRVFYEQRRREILVNRPAPIQVNYIGHPGTSGAEYFDYIIADRWVLPMDQQSFFTEKIVHLPDCYQINDRKRAISSRPFERGQIGLSARGFVFCCFNNNFKIREPIFDVWMRLLKAVDGSVLLLLRGNEAAEENLLREAEARGVGRDRVVFLDRLNPDEHLARHRLADLFLDTLPYNAHTTASDALWAGLPVLTCTGNTFAGRVGASLLHAVGLPELVTHNLADYEALALKLATEPALLQGIRQRLADRRLDCPLFDSDRFRRHLEAAFMTMWQIRQHGDAPRSFSVEPSAADTH